MLGIPFLKFGAFLCISSYLHYAVAAKIPPSPGINLRTFCRGSLFLPFYNGYDLAETARPSLRLGTEPQIHHVQMDTGSTGFLADPAKIGGYNPSTAASLGYEAGYEYLSSSNNIYTGYSLS